MCAITFFEPRLFAYFFGNGKSKSPAGSRRGKICEYFCYWQLSSGRQSRLKNQCDRAIFLKKSGNPYVVSKWGNREAGYDKCSWIIFSCGTNAQLRNHLFWAWPFCLLLWSRLMGRDKSKSPAGLWGERKPFENAWLLKVPPKSKNNNTLKWKNIIKKFEKLLTNPYICQIIHYKIKTILNVR